MFLPPSPVQVDQRTSPLCEEEEDVPSMMRIEMRMCPAGLQCEQGLDSDLESVIHLYI